MRVKARSQEDLEWTCKPTKMGMARAMTLINFQGTSLNRWVCSHTIVVIPFLCYYGKGQCAKSFHCYIVDEIRSHPMELDPSCFMSFMTIQAHHSKEGRAEMY